MILLATTPSGLGVMRSCVLLIAVLTALIVLSTTALQESTSMTSLIPPLIPDFPFKPVDWKQRQAGWTRKLELAGPFIANLTGVTIHSVPAYPTCDKVQAVFRRHGINGAAEALSVEDCHALGQVVAYAAIETGMVEQVMPAINTLSREGQKVTWDHPRPVRFGYLHGATIVILNERWGHSPNIANWAYILEVICDGKETMDMQHIIFCIHGVGHGHTLIQPGWQSPPTSPSPLY